jgi:putative ABC transport system permease protein
VVNLDRLGTNLLTVSPGQSFFGDASHLPEEAISMIGRIGPVTSVSAIGRLPDARVYRNDRIPSGQSGGVGVYATKLDLLPTVAATVASGTWLNDATQRYPAVVLGAQSKLDFDGYATTVYTRSRTDQVEAVQAVLAATVNPENPNEVKVSRPSDALAAKQATDESFTGLLLGLGAVALLVGGVGGILATLAIGAVAGLYPAVRASRLAPTEALSTP